MKTTEQFVHGIFCDCAFRHNNPKQICPYKLCDRWDWKKYANFARRFVRLEQREKLAGKSIIQKIEMRLKKEGKISPKLPPHFGEIKVGGKWVKF